MISSHFRIKDYFKLFYINKKQTNKQTKKKILNRFGLTKPLKKFFFLIFILDLAASTVNIYIYIYLFSWMSLVKNILISNFLNFIYNIVLINNKYYWMHFQIDNW